MSLHSSTSSTSRRYCCYFFFLMIRRPPRSTLSSSSAASDVYKRQPEFSALKLARIRKAGGGDAVDAALAEVRPRAAPRDPKPPKGRKADRLKPERMAKVERLLTRQPELIAKMKETRKTQAAEKAKKKAMGNPTI
eukprot:TRINITY_DN2448_c0_g1_i1.p1 TRINITY_DN2448_c0_g1~~TRINITY_DN2448_c0_g1_i1.p1  ORF type:complete len:136 (+),score=28.62 TRINITY_DN2448_c0_g1_i1:3-410(+)